MASTKRVHIRTAVNAANVSKTGSVYTIKDVCGAVDGIVMNSVLYPADQLAAGAKTMEGRPAPAGHPKNAHGQAISALNGDALLTSYIGAICRNARHVGGRTLCDIVINEAQAKAHPDGAKLVERLDSAIAGTNSDPIHVSTGLYFEPVDTPGEANGRAYNTIATNLRYDHLAILLNERGAGTPEDGVGMWLNEANEPEQIDVVTLNADPEDARSKGLKAWLLKLVGNGAVELSFDQISSGLYALLPREAWLREVYDRYVIWADGQGNNYRQDYSVGSDGSLAFSSDPQAVKREVSYVPITNRQEDDNVKSSIIAALNAAGISGVAAMTDDELLTAYNALQAKPHIAALNAEQAAHGATKGKLAEFEIAANAARDAELNTLATELATNSSSLTADDFKAMGLARCKELKAKAAPVVVGTNAAGKQVDEFDYDINALGKEA